MPELHSTLGLINVNRNILSHMIEKQHRPILYCRPGHQEFREGLSGLEHSYLRAYVFCATGFCICSSIVSRNVTPRSDTER